MTKAFKRVIQVETEENETVFIHLYNLSSVKVDKEGNVWVNSQGSQHFLEGRAATEFLALYETWLEKGEKQNVLISAP